MQHDPQQSHISARMEVKAIKAIVGKIPQEVYCQLASAKSPAACEEIVNAAVEAAVYALRGLR